MGIGPYEANHQTSAQSTGFRAGINPQGVSVGADCISAQTGLRFALEFDASSLALTIKNLPGSLKIRPVRRKDMFYTLKTRPR